MQVSVGISGHHLHLTEDDFKILFGSDAVLNNISNLNQPGEFASDKVVDIKYNDRMIPNVRVVGPLRKYTQVELSKTEYIKLKTMAPIRQSGDLENAISLTIVGKVGEVTRNCGIIAERHIHITKEQKELFGFSNVREVKVKFNKNRSGTFNNVVLKVKDEAYFELHVDTDEANAFNLENGDVGEIIIE